MKEKVGYNDTKLVTRYKAFIEIYLKQDSCSKFQ